MGMNINIIILCARCRRGSRPAVSWCAMPLSMVILSAFVPCPVIVPMLYVLSTYASPAAPCAHAVMLAAPCPAVPCLPDQRRPLPPRLPSCRVLVCYAFVYGRTARLCALPCHCSYAPCIASVCQPCSSTRPCCNAGGFLSRADPAAPCPALLTCARPAVSWCVLPCIWSYCLPWLPCPVIVPMLHVLPVYASPAAPHAHAVMLAASCPVRILPRRACLAGVRAPAAACLPHICLCVCMFTCLHVYMFTCLHVYKLPSEMAYLSAIWNAQRDKQRPEQ